MRTCVCPLTSLLLVLSRIALPLTRITSDVTLAFSIFSRSSTNNLNDHQAVSPVGERSRTLDIVLLYSSAQAIMVPPVVNVLPNQNPTLSRSHETNTGQRKHHLKSKRTVLRCFCSSSCSSRAARLLDPMAWESRCRQLIRDSGYFNSSAERSNSNFFHRSCGQNVVGHD